MPNYKTLLNGLTFADALALSEKQASAAPEQRARMQQSPSPLPDSSAAGVAKTVNVLREASAELAGRVRLRNDPGSGKILTADELAELKREFGWSPTGPGDGGAALLEMFKLNGHAATPLYDGMRAGWASRDINVRGCAPRKDYNPAKSPQGDCRDGIRHALWSARMAQRNPEMAAAVGDGRERMAPSSYKSHRMDLHNNRIGREIGVGNPDADYRELLEFVVDAMRSGELVSDVGSVPPAPADTEMARRRAALYFNSRDPSAGGYR
ncbi:hypothetical protein I6F07_08830 [Ensifer sp. IC4062]|nr:hypothetical protein [Ensifer sp. IC4062]MCA1440313.1 hypothetical protein [Ensifer sp. IC4062]